jgi:hypothetical protein
MDLALQWDRTVESVRDAVRYVRRVGGYSCSGYSRNRRRRGPRPTGSYTDRMKRIWAEWDGA